MFSEVNEWGISQNWRQWKSTPGSNTEEIAAGCMYV